MDRINKKGPEKCTVTLKLPFIIKSSEVLEKKKQLIRNTYYAANLRIVFTTKPLLTPSGKDLVSNFNKSIVVFQYSCCCTASYIRFPTRQLRKRIKRYVPKNVDNFCYLDKKDDIPTKVLNASKRLSIAEHLVNNNNQTCANSYNINRFKIIKTCKYIFDLI